MQPQRNREALPDEPQRADPRPPKQLTRTPNIAALFIRGRDGRLPKKAKQGSHPDRSHRVHCAVREEEQETIPTIKHDASTMEAEGLEKKKVERRIKTRLIL